MKKVLCRITGMLELAFLVARAVQAMSKVIFHRYGNRYFLSQIWVAGNSLGTSAKEKEQALLAHNEAPDQITIVTRFISRRGWCPSTLEAATPRESESTPLDCRFFCFYFMAAVCAVAELTRATQSRRNSWKAFA